jgi:hypothetical protein
MDNLPAGRYVVHESGAITHPDGTAVSLLEEQQRIIAERLWAWRAEQARLLEEWAKDQGNE